MIAPAHTQTTYRREIDGLRALAVLPVIFFHAGFSLFGGGFVGVDVFFVISGYLITSIILQDRAAGEFSLAGFYERRARRILPALFVVMFACLLPAWLWLLPVDLRNFSESLATVATFSSNFLFWKESGYFESAAELKPLLHTWSLAVEEQYYVFFPLMMLLLLRHSKLLAITVLSLAGITSLSCAEYGTREFPSAAFFLLPTRGWELLAGALLAFPLTSVRSMAPLTRGAREAGSVAGLLLLLYAVFNFDRTTPFPGVHALIPVTGTALLIFFGDNTTRVGQLLGARVLVATGLISYSAYLWHQPLFAFARHLSLGEPSAGTFLWLSGLTFLLAWPTWKYVENPWRNKAIFKRKTVVLTAIAGTAMFTLLGIVGHINDGFSARFPAFVANMERAKADTNPLRSRCHAESGLFATPDDACILGDHTRVVGALLGDSHADALAYEIGRALAQKGVGIRQMSYGSCPPVTGIHRREFPQCARYNDAVHEYIAASSDMQWLVLSARWTIFLEQQRFDNGEGGIENNADTHVDAIIDGRIVTDANDATRFRQLSTRYVATVRRLLALGKHIVLVYPVPEAGWKVPDRLSKLYLLHGSITATDASTSQRRFRERNLRTLAVLDSIGKHPNLHRVYPEKFFCGTQVPGRCITHLGGIPLYSDDDHLANTGARIVAHEIAELIPAPGR